MTTKLGILTPAALAFAAATSAPAATLTFDDLAVRGTAITSIGATYSDQGFTANGTQLSTIGIDNTTLFANPGDIDNAGLGSIATTLSLKADDLGTFTFGGFDFRGFGPSTVTVSGTNTDGALVSSTIISDTDFQSVESFAGFGSDLFNQIDFTIGSGSFLFDNVEFTRMDAPPPNPSQVPLPGGLPLALAGLASLAALRLTKDM